jgi:hypothetical protein
LAEAKTKRAKKAESVVTPVVRDSTFHRAVVDTALVIGLGQSVEISCLQSGIALNAIHQLDEGVKMDGDQVFTEVLRLRFSWPAAVMMAMNVLRAGVSSGTINPTEMLAQLAELQAEGEADAE